MENLTSLETWWKFSVDLSRVFWKKVIGIGLLKRWVKKPLLIKVKSEAMFEKLLE
jgi:hypothetical protein